MMRAGSDKRFHYGKALRPGERQLACYAAGAVPSRGRFYPEQSCEIRNHLQRDRDRIIHCTAFRRLTYKTQMFVYHEGDHYRTRLTHSLEVAQIARTLARQLCLDEDLAEAVALGHDLGHPPFGHAGEKALDHVLNNAGGFDHNVQSFRLVTVLEHKYQKFNGLNLCWETLEGLAKHNGPPAHGTDPGALRFVHSVRKFQQNMDLHLDKFASGEAQAAAIADDIAWHTHDIDDGLRAGLIKLDDLQEVPLLHSIVNAMRSDQLCDPGRQVYELRRRLITMIINDVIDESRHKLGALQPAGPDDIRSAAHTIVTFSAEMQTRLDELRTFLFVNLYHHRVVMQVMEGAQKVVRDLVRHYAVKPSDMPAGWNENLDHLSERKRLRRIGDFVAGMTDRYAIAEHKRLFDDTPELRYSADNIL